MSLSETALALALQAGIDLNQVDPEWLGHIVEVLTDCERDMRLSLSGQEVADLSGVSCSRVEQIARMPGELPSFTDGGRRRFLKRPAYYRIVRAIARSHPANRPASKIVRPGGFRPKRPSTRPRTPQELEGLRRGNLKRAEAARLKRETQEATTA